MGQVIDAPPMEGIAMLVVTPGGWGGASLTLRLGCGTANPLTAVIEGLHCKPKVRKYEYKLVEPSTLITVLDVGLPIPCYLHIDLVATKGSSSKTGSRVVGVSQEGPVVIGLPYSIYEPIELY